MPSESDDEVKARLDWISAHGYESFKPESTQSRLKKKLKENPFVPIGCLATAGILGVGLSTMISRNTKRSQLFMRLRVLSQGLTVAAIMGGVVYNATKKKSIE